MRLGAQREPRPEIAKPRSKLQRNKWLPLPKKERMENECLGNALNTVPVFHLSSIICLFSECAG